MAIRKKTAPSKPARTTESPDARPVRGFVTPAAWEAWLARHLTNYRRAAVHAGTPPGRHSSGR